MEKVSKWTKIFVRGNSNAAFIFCMTNLSLSLSLFLLSYSFSPPSHRYVSSFPTLSILYQLVCFFLTEIVTTSGPEIHFPELMSICCLEVPCRYKTDIDLLIKIFFIPHNIRFEQKKERKKSSPFWIVCDE